MLEFAVMAGWYIIRAPGGKIVAIGTQGKNAAVSQSIGALVIPEVSKSLSGFDDIWNKLSIVDTLRGVPRSLRHKSCVYAIPSVEPRLMLNTRTKAIEMLETHDWLEMSASRSFR
jgi:hypothetical protein